MPPKQQLTPADIAEAKMTKQNKIGNYILHFLTNTFSKTSINAQTKSFYKARIELLEKYWSEFMNMHDVLSEEFSEELRDNAYFTNNQFTIAEDAYIEAKAALGEKIDAFDSRNESILNHTAVNQSMVCNHGGSKPNIDPPKFNGNQSDWESFKQLFCSMVKDVPNLSPVIKFQYLLRACEGRAKDRIKSLPVIGSNLDVAWDKLLRRYDNPKIRLAKHIDAMVNLPRVIKREVDQLNALVDKADEAIQGLKDLECPTEQYDNWFVRLVVSKLDSATREDWEISEETNPDFPTYANLVKFLERRIKSMEQARTDAKEDNDSSKNKTKNSTSFNSNSANRQVFANVANSSERRTVTPYCFFCKNSHWIQVCKKFEKLSPPQRYDFVKRNRLCLKCLRKNHYLATCPSTTPCSAECDQNHHKLLHISSDSRSHRSNLQSDSGSSGNSSTTNTKSGDSSTTDTVSSHLAMSDQTRLLATAQIILGSNRGNSMEVRALIDPAAECSFVSERVVQLLAVSGRAVSVSVVGIGTGVTCSSKKQVSLILQSKVDPSFRYRFNAFVVREPTRCLPKHDISGASWKHIDDLTLADPNFSQSSRVDCVLSAEIYPVIIREGIRSGPVDTPLAQNTVFGWILTGNTKLGSEAGETERVQGFSARIESSISTTLIKFWEIEEIVQPRILSIEDQYCEDFFQRTTSRDAEGRFVVRLPFSQRLTNRSFVDSREIAYACLIRSEKKRQSNDKLNLAYAQFMDEYVQLGHMEVVSPKSRNGGKYYLPHHAVFREGSSKIRVVFNASQKCGNGLSLNDVLLPGPKLQSDVRVVLIIWRFFRVVFTTDIVKMFRQFRVHPDDADWQRLVWRSDTSKPVEEYRATTVTYGTATAPYLALRALKQLAEDGKEEFPLGSETLDKRRYVDDIFSGAHDMEAALIIRNQLIQLLATAGITLGKWASNNKDLLDGLTDAGEQPFSVKLDDVVSTLGLKWVPSDDHFLFEVSLPVLPKKITKRIILSEASKLFDPLGWLSPFLIRSKVLLQDLWLAKIDWDTAVSGSLLDQWIEFRAQIPLLSNIRIPRWMNAAESKSWQLHGFSDASMRAYSASIYLVIPGESSTLIVAKTKVAPVKTQSLPRLELCGALLLVRLVKFILPQLPHAPSSIHFWSDSTIVLDWLQSHPSKWQVFVANRVSEITTAFPEVSWRHVESQDNPADCATRGYTPAQLDTSSLWWKGPNWLVQDEKNWPSKTFDPIDEEIVAHMTQELATNESPQSTNSSCLPSLLKFSNYFKVRRILAYIYRWRFNAKLAKGSRRDNWLSAKELHAAKFGLFKAIQLYHFSKEISCLESKSPLPKSSPLVRLVPFIDSHGLLRVGGRLQNSTLTYSEKHPIILPANNSYVHRLVEAVHLCTLHGGVQLMLSFIGSSIWILRGLRLVQGVYRKCTRCLRLAAQPVQQQMAPLPAFRTEPQHPFACCGLDYAGPIPVLFSRGRGAKSTKGYVSIFICLVTRAVHVEIVSELTAAAFLAAFKRFTSRRGLCRQLFSDNGTTFKGAAGEIERMFSEASAVAQEIATALAEDEVAWSFIPPRGPHFGGIWEAAVKSFKHHFLRQIGDNKLTYEELSTVAAQIEACLNTRPLCPLSSDANSFSALTPAHLLNGFPLSILPEPFSVDQLKCSPSSRWKLLLQMRNNFWHRWRKEVLQNMQTRNKWLKPQTNLKLGDIVLLKDDLYPPGKWPLGKITALHPGKDGLTRVVTIKTASSEFVRPVVKVVRLLSDDTVNLTSVKLTSNDPAEESSQSPQEGEEIQDE